MNEEILNKIYEELKKLNLQTKQVYTTEELAELLETYPQKINLWRKYGLLKGINKGRGYIFTASEVQKFLKENDGKDLSYII